MDRTHCSVDKIYLSKGLFLSIQFFLANVFLHCHSFFLYHLIIGQVKWNLSFTVDCFVGVACFKTLEFSLRY